MITKEHVLIECERRRRHSTLSSRQRFLYDTIVNGAKAPNDYSKDELTLLGLENAFVFSSQTIEFSAYDTLSREFFSEGILETGERIKGLPW